MPMLHGCGFPGCSTFTLSTYCVEHELHVRALKEAERTHGGHEVEVSEPALEAVAAATGVSTAEAPALS
jgi:hypothetical protein